MGWLRRAVRAARGSRWAPIRKVAAAFLAGLVGWGGWAIWLAGNGDLDAGAGLRAGALAALPVLVAYLTPSRPADVVQGSPSSTGAAVEDP